MMEIKSTRGHTTWLGSGQGRCFAVEMVILYEISVWQFRYYNDMLLLKYLLNGDLNEQIIVQNLCLY